MRKEDDTSKIDGVILVLRVAYPSDEELFYYNHSTSGKISVKNAVSHRANLSNDIALHDKFHQIFLLTSSRTGLRVLG